MDLTGSDNDEVRRLLNLLQALMRLLGVSNREVERRMGLNQGQVSRVLSGQIEAKMQLVLGVARSIGLEYDEFFAFAYPEPRPAAEKSAAARNVRTLLENIRPSVRRLERVISEAAQNAPAPPRGEAANQEERVEELKQIVREVVREMRAAEDEDPST